MAKQVIALEATLNSSPAEGSVKSLKAQLREAQAEVAAMSDKFGETSTQAANAARRAAELKDKIGDAKLLTDAFNPDAKFKAFGNALRGVVGGFSALQGAQALFGSESEEVAKVLAKVQGAMVLSQGIDSVLESKDAFKALGTMIKTNVVSAFATLKGAIISTGIGVLIVAVGVLVEQLMAMSDAADEAAESQKKLNEQTKKFAEEGLKAELDYLNRTEKLEIAKAKQAGKSEEEIFAIQQSYRASRIKSQSRAYDELKNVDAKAADELKNQIKNANVDGQTAEIEHQLKLEEIRKKAAEDKRQKQKEENDKIKEDIRKANEDARNQTKKLQEENLLASLKDERKKQEAALQIQFENQQNDILKSAASKKEKDALLLELEKNYLLNLGNLRQGFADEDEKKKKEKEKEDEEKAKELFQRNEDALNQAQKLADENYLNTIKNEEERAKEKERINYENRVAEINAMQIGEFEKNSLLQQESIKHQNILTDIEKKGQDDRNKNEEAAYKTKVELWQQTGQLLGELSDIAGKQTAIGKGLALAQIAIDTGLAISALTKNSESNPTNSVTFGAAGAIQFAAGLIRIIANIKKAKDLLKSANVPADGGGGGGGNLSSAPPAIPAPIAPQLGATALNQQLINQSGNAAVRAFVLETDVSGNQERIRRLNRAARIN
jgi:hypothetical protein